MTRSTTSLQNSAIDELAHFDREVIPERRTRARAREIWVRLGQFIKPDAPVRA